MPQQHQRHEVELSKAQRQHSVESARSVLKWFEKQRLIGEVFTDFECEALADAQCRLHYVRPEHIRAVVGLIVDVYMQRS